MKAEPTKKFKSYLIDYIHIDSAEILTENGKLYMFGAIEGLTVFEYTNKCGTEQPNRFIDNPTYNFPGLNI